MDPHRDPVLGVAIGFFVGIELILGGVLWMAVAWAVRSLPDTTSASPAWSLNGAPDR